MGGHFTEPYEQNTQQSPSRGLSNTPHASHSWKYRHAFVGMVSDFACPHSGQVRTDSSTTSTMRVWDTAGPAPSMFAPRALHVLAPHGFDAPFPTPPRPGQSENHAELGERVEQQLVDAPIAALGTRASNEQFLRPPRSTAGRQLEPRFDTVRRVAVARRHIVETAVDEATASRPVIIVEGEVDKRSARRKVIARDAPGDRMRAHRACRR